MSTYAPGTVTALPSGQYGSRIVDPDASTGHGPVVQVVQRIGTEWHGTPARHYAETIAGSTGRLAIDYGQGWGLDEADSAAHYAYAAGALAERDAVSASGQVVDSPSASPQDVPTSPAHEETTVSTTTVHIPTTVRVPFGCDNGFGEIPGAADNVDPSWAKAAARANRKVKGLTAEQRATFAALYDGAEVDVAVLTDAVVAATAAAATRLGQSMARRYQRDLLVATWSWLKAGAPVPADPPSWTTGTTVTCTIVDGALVLDVDLSEITDKHAAEYADDAALDAFPVADARCAEAGQSVRIIVGAL